METWPEPWLHGNRHRNEKETPMPAPSPDLRHTYRDHIVAGIDRILSTQDAALTRVRQVIVQALAADRLVFVAGSGHSHMVAEEVFYRAGGIAAAQAILDPELMLHLGAAQSTLLEREPGRARAVLERYPVGPGDVVFVVSNSGRNPYPIEMALVARERGAITVALTSLDHSRQTTSRHDSGKRLFEVTDHVIDSGGTYGDAALPIPGRDISMGPLSTITGVFILNALLAEAVAALARQGHAIDVYQSANRQGAEAEAAAHAMVERWRGRMVGL
jgi:uncharacterized phosphosugar-binding protein